MDGVWLKDFVLGKDEAETTFHLRQTASSHGFAALIAQLSGPPAVTRRTSERVAQTFLSGRDRRFILFAVDQYET